MNVEVFSEWLSRQGHQVIRTESSYWYKAGPGILQAFPYHWIIQPSLRELRDLVHQEKMAALRYSSPFEGGGGMVSYHVVLDSPYNLRRLSDSTRSDIRRGLRHSQVEVISCERLAEEGWILQQDTLERQGRISSMSQSDWKRICLAAEGLPGFEAWAAIHNGELVSSLLSYTLDHTVYILYQQSKTSFLKFRVNNALIHHFTDSVLQRPGILSVFYGLHSLDAPPTVDEFKFRMGYWAKPVRQMVVFSPYLQPLINSLSHRFIKALLNILPSNSSIAKTEGVVRFYLEGKRPLSVQKWPKVLLRHKNAILKEDEKIIEMPNSNSMENP
jgi:hypothetical protein